MNNYYAILGLKSGATLVEIKSAYRKLAKKHHPDRNGGDDKQFVKILEAYEILKKIHTDPYTNMAREWVEVERTYATMVKQAEYKARQKARARAAHIRKKKEEEQAREYARGIRFIGIAILTIIAAVYCYKGINYWMVSQNSVYTLAQVTGLGQNRMHYQFVTDKGVREESQYVSNSDLTMLSDNGMPLHVGHHFEIQYNQKHPFFHHINFQKPSAATVQGYLMATVNKVLTIYEKQWQELNEIKRRQKARCLVALVYRDFGIDGLSHLYFYKEHPLKNWSHNSWRWYFFKRGKKFKDIQALCNQKFPSS